MSGGGRNDLQVQEIISLAMQIAASGHGGNQTNVWGATPGAGETALPPAHSAGANNTSAPWGPAGHLNPQALLSNLAGMYTNQTAGPPQQSALQTGVSGAYDNISVQNAAYDNIQQHISQGTAGLDQSTLVAAAQAYIASLHQKPAIAPGGSQAPYIGAPLPSGVLQGRFPSPRGQRTTEHPLSEFNTAMGAFQYQDHAQQLRSNPPNLHNQAPSSSAHGQSLAHSHAHPHPHALHMGRHGALLQESYGGLDLYPKGAPSYSGNGGLHMVPPGTSVHHGPPLLHTTEQPVVRKQRHGATLEKSLGPTVFPRRKAGQEERPSSSPVILTPLLLQTLYKLPLHEASARLGISVTAMKSACRRMGISKWPYMHRAMGGSTGTAKSTAKTSGSSISSASTKKAGGSNSHHTSSTITENSSTTSSSHTHRSPSPPSNSTSHVCGDSSSPVSFDGRSERGRSEKAGQAGKRERSGDESKRAGKRDRSAGDSKVATSVESSNDRMDFARALLFGAKGARGGDTSSSSGKDGGESNSMGSSENLTCSSETSNSSEGENRAKDSVEEKLEKQRIQEKKSSSKSWTDKKSSSRRKLEAKEKEWERERVELKERIAMLEQLEQEHSKDHGHSKEHRKRKESASDRESKKSKASTDIEPKESTSVRT